MGLRRIVLIAGVHLALSFASAFAAEGWDLDQLRSRSRVSQVAGVLQDVLMYPHDTAMRALPNALLVRNKHLIPLAVFVNSLFWGVVLYVLWRAIRGSRRQRPQL